MIIDYKDKFNFRYKFPIDENGKPHGLSRSWHSNGNLYNERNYKDGKQHGLYRSWTYN